LLTKRTQIIPVLVVALVFPAAALAATDSGDTAKAGIDGAKAVQIPALQRPVARFKHLVHVVGERIEGEHRAALRKRQRERFATLPGGVTEATLESIASCESGDDPTAISSDGTYRGKFQFDYATWESVGGHGDPAAAPEAEQDYRAALLYSRSSSSPWPVCG
jgi:hypothetical protein